MDNYTNMPRCYDVLSTPRPPTPSPPPSRRLLRRRNVDGAVQPRPRRMVSSKSAAKDTSDLDSGPGPVRSSLRNRACGNKSYSRSSLETSESSDSSICSHRARPPYSEYCSSDEEPMPPLDDDDEEAEVANFLQQLVPSADACPSHFTPMISLVPASLGTLLVHNVLDKLSLLPAPQPVHRTHRPSHMPRVRPKMPLNRYGNPLYPPSLRPYIIEEDDAEYRIAAHDGEREFRIPLSRNHFDHCLARHTSNMLRIYRVPVDRACKYDTICAKYGLVTQRVSKPEKGSEGITLWMQGYRVSLEQLENEDESEDCWMLVAGKHRRKDFEEVVTRKKVKERSCASRIMDAASAASSRVYGTFAWS